MKVESRIFEILTIFFFVVGIVYVVLAQEPVGSRRAVPDRRPVADRRHVLPVRRPAPRGAAPRTTRTAEISDGAGDVGFFSPGQLLADRAGRRRSR